MKSCAAKGRAVRIGLKQRYFYKVYRSTRTTNIFCSFPFRGLYEGSQSQTGLLEQLQSIALMCGPSTMAALLNSLQMSSICCYSETAPTIQRVSAKLRLSSDIKVEGSIASAKTKKLWIPFDYRTNVYE